MRFELYRTAFDEWCALLPPGGRVLDVGCGHGLPIAAELARRGFVVEGIDVSPGMVARAQANVPSGRFRCLAAAELDEVERYDGACSFYSLLCMDPIELRIRCWRAECEATLC